MKTYNIEKTIELNQSELDFEKGYLKNDKRFVAHHGAIPYKKGRTVQEIAAELETQGFGVEIGYDGLPRRILESDENGSIGETIVAEPDVPAKDAWDEYEDIQVYIPYTESEIKDRLRNKRVSLLNAFDKWEKAVLRGREADDAFVMAWYRDLLNLDESAFEIIPARVQYYL